MSSGAFVGLRQGRVAVAVSIRSDRINWLFEVRVVWCGV